jgi:hypothetical protein
MEQLPRGRREKLQETAKAQGAQRFELQDKKQIYPRLVNANCRSEFIRDAVLAPATNRE